MLAGLFVGAAIPAVPYPCLMLAAHSAGFIAGGLLSMIAGLSLSSSRCKLRLDQSAPRRCGGITTLARRRRRSEAARLTSEV